jgi:hypothetical protein
MNVLSSVTCRLCSCALVGLALLGACEQTASAKVSVEKLPEVKPSLPPVPTIPPPPYPTQYADQTYSVYGVRRVLRRTINTEVTVTGYIAKVFTPPECPPKEKCPLPSAPHFWLGDTATEADPAKLLLVAGYAESQKALDDAAKEAKRGKKKSAAAEEAGIIPVPTDLFPGAKLKLKGKFTYMSGAGFQGSEGVLDYAGHETLEPGTPPPPPSGKPASGKPSGKSASGKKR